MNTRFITIDEEGYFKFGDLRVTDREVGHQMLSDLQRDERGAILTRSDSVPVIVEAFDEPLVATMVSHPSPHQWLLQAPYGFEAHFSLESLSLDDWDRFHGYSREGVPFVLSRSAQNEFFNLLESFTDETITSDGQTLEIPLWLRPRTEDQVNNAEFWTQIYLEKGTPGWELNEPAAPLVQVLPQLKIAKSRVLVLGCGSGNDAAFLAQQGHLVTAVDVSEEAIRRAQEKYGHIKNLQLICTDVFSLGAEHYGQYDLIFEHTFFCAIHPNRRQELVKLWKRFLNEHGLLLGIFFVFDRPIGPPFGGSEWELRERLKKDFDFLYWTRWQHSTEGRQGVELVVHARRRP